MQLWYVFQYPFLYYCIARHVSSPSVKIILLCKYTLYEFPHPIFNSLLGNEMNKQHGTTQLFVNNAILLEDNASVMSFHNKSTTKMHMLNLKNVQMVRFWNQFCIKSLVIKAPLKHIPEINQHYNVLFMTTHRSLIYHWLMQSILQNISIMSFYNFCPISAAIGATITFYTSPPSFCLLSVCYVHAHIILSGTSLRRIHFYRGIINFD